MLDALIVIFVVWIRGSFLAIGVESISLFLWCARQGAPVSFFYAGIPRVTWKTYFSWCRQSGKVPDESRVRRYRLIRRNFLASLVGLMALLVIAGLRNQLACGS